MKETEFKSNCSNFQTFWESVDFTHVDERQNICTCRSNNTQEFYTSDSASLICLPAFQFLLMAVSYACLRTMKSITSGMSWYLKNKEFHQNKCLNHTIHIYVSLIIEIKANMFLSSISFLIYHLSFSWMRANFGSKYQIA